jgi:N-acetylglucosaminyldiphosphoundecaprenol N-acetyl-beta-D-mannosaminyltransferase
MTGTNWRELVVAYIRDEALTPDEDAAIVESITASGARLLFVGLGCPKQERWIVEHLGRVPVVMLAVGPHSTSLPAVKAGVPDG